MKVGESVSEEIIHEVWGSNDTSIRARNWNSTSNRVGDNSIDVVWVSVREPVSDTAQLILQVKHKAKIREHESR